MISGSLKIELNRVGKNAHPTKLRLTLTELKR